jgi:hypothetical protein
VVSDVKAGATIVIPKGARATGRLLEVNDRKMLGRPGKLVVGNLKIEVADEETVTLSSVIKKEGQHRYIIIAILVLLSPVTFVLVYSLYL